MSEDTPHGSVELISDLLERIISDDYDSNVLDTVINLIYSSRDPSSLLILFNSPRQTAQLNAIYILSEVGAVCRPLLEKAVEFTGHAHWQARFWALGCILAGAMPADGRALAAGTLLLCDGDSRVRSKAIDFVSRLDESKVVAARDALTASGESVEIGAALSRFLGYSLDSIDDLLVDAKSADDLARAVALAFGARAIRTGRKVAKRAQRSNEPATSDFAKSLL